MACYFQHKESMKEFSSKTETLKKKQSNENIHNNVITEDYDKFKTRNLKRKEIFSRRTVPDVTPSSHWIWNQVSETTENALELFQLLLFFRL